MSEHSLPVADAEDLAEMAREGRNKELSAALEAGVSANTVDHKKYSLLMHAASYGNLSTLELLLQHGADVRYVDPLRGRTALGAALYRAEASCVERLLRAGADPDAGRPSARELAKEWNVSDLLP